MSTLDPDSQYPAFPAEVKDRIAAVVSEYPKDVIYHLASVQNLVLAGLVSPFASNNQASTPYRTVANPTIRA